MFRVIDCSSFSQHSKASRPSENERYREYARVVMVDNGVKNRGVPVFSASHSTRSLFAHSTTMLKEPLLLSIVLLAALVSTDNKLVCNEVDGYKVCHRNRVLVEVTQLTGVSHLTIYDLDLLSIREDAFKNLTTILLNFAQGNRISEVKRESFRGLPQLEYLYLDSNEVSLSRNLFSELPKLRFLVLQFNKIQKIPEGSFAGLSNLRSLYLDNNYITEVRRNTFAGLTKKLTELYLNNNQIRRIEAGAFQNLSGVSWLQLDNNQLKELHPGSFTGLKNVVGLMLSNNCITALQPDTFQGLNHLKVLHLDNNEIITIAPFTFSGLPELKVLNLSGNKMHNIQDGSFSASPLLGDLVLLDLSNMLIDTVDPDAFEPLQALLVLYIRGTNITEIDKNYVGLPVFTQVYLH